MSSNSDSAIEQIVLYFEDVIHRDFADDVSQVYIGDVGIYPPSAFQDSNGNDMVAVSIQIENIGKADDKTRSHAGEVRPVLINIVPMINMVPEFEAMPTKAFGEMRLLKFVTRMTDWLSKSENSTLHGRVTTSEYLGVDFDFMQRGAMSIRAAAIRWEAKVYIDNL
jgi:hypothetical protein